MYMNLSDIVILNIKGAINAELLAELVKIRPCKKQNADLTEKVEHYKA